MKKLFSTFSIILFIGVLGSSAECCNGATADNSLTSKAISTENQKSSEVKAYYFHATRRCATCQAIEKVAKEAIKEYYGDKVTFESINVEKESPLLAKYKINGQTFLIVKGDKKVNLTNDAFLNARTKPERFKNKIKSTIDSMM